MPIVSIVPTSKKIECDLLKNLKTIRDNLKGIISYEWKIDREDIMVNLITCPYTEPDKDMTDVIIYIETTADDILKSLADRLKKRLARSISPYVNSAEIWIRFMTGSWCMIKGKEIIYSNDMNG